VYLTKFIVLRNLVIEDILRIVWHPEVHYLDHRSSQIIPHPEPDESNPLVILFLPDSIHVSQKLEKILENFHTKRVIHSGVCSPLEFNRRFGRHFSFILRFKA
jgi:hypothetical protein